MPGITVTGAVTTSRLLEVADLEGLAGDEGVPMAAVLERVGPHPEATQATVGSRDGSYRASIPLTDLVFHGRLRRGADGSLRLLLAGTTRRCFNVKDVGVVEVTVGPVPDTVPHPPEA